MTQTGTTSLHPVHRRVIKAEHVLRISRQHPPAPQRVHPIPLMVTSTGRQSHVQPCRGVATDGGIRQVLVALHPCHTLRNQLSRRVRGSHFLIGAPTHRPHDRLLNERLQISRVRR